MSADDKKKLDGIKAGAVPRYYAVCDTAAATAAKVVTVDDTFELVTGAQVTIKFTYANSVASPTLNVNGTGAKPIYRYGTTAVSTGTTTSGWIAGTVQTFTYDGKGWVRDYWNNTTYSNASLGSGYGTCTTAAATVAKVVTLSSYSLTTGGIVAVKFSYAVPAGATLNINSKGAKAIYYRGVAIPAGVINAGDIATLMYNGSQYHVLSVDRDLEKKTGVFYIEGSGGTAGVWTGTHADITEYYEGLMIAYKVGISGSANGVTLNINGLGAVPVVRNRKIAVTTEYSTETVMHLVYTTDSETTSTSGGSMTLQEPYWKICDLDTLPSHDHDDRYYTETEVDNKLSGKSDSGHTHNAGEIKSGTLGVARGGTGKASWAANRLMYPSAATTMAQLAFPTTAGSFLRQGTSGAPYWSTPAETLNAIGAAPASHNHDGEYINPAAIELQGSSNHGGYIDFHYGQSTGDFTTRIQEVGAGILRLYVNGSSNAVYDIFTEYNKPNGSYNGTGSATARTITVNNTTAHEANIIVIVSSNGYFTFAGIWGAFSILCTTGGITGFYSNQLQFTGGKINIASTSAAVNGAGVTYYYYML